MSELSELIKITRNIESQNDEIIRLLKKIAGEDEPVYVSPLDIKPAPVEVEEHDPLLDVKGEVGKVYFIDVCEVYKLSVENNETTIDNLTSSSETNNYNLQEMIANESIRNNQPLPDATVILNKENVIDLPSTLKVCVDEKVKKVYLPWSSMTQLIGAPEVIMTILKLDFYKTEEELIAKLFE